MLFKRRANSIEIKSTSVPDPDERETARAYEPINRRW
jgi:hypothetical protein